jgi:hypothetical protein
MDMSLGVPRQGPRRRIDPSHQPPPKTCAQMPMLRHASTNRQRSHGSCRTRRSEEEAGASLPRVLCPGCSDLVNQHSNPQGISPRGLARHRISHGDIGDHSVTLGQIRPGGWCVVGPSQSGVNREAPSQRQCAGQSSREKGPSHDHIPHRARRWPVIPANNITLRESRGRSRPCFCISEMLSEIQPSIIPSAR